MSIKVRSARDIFPVFNTVVYPPLDPTWNQPKDWGVAVTWIQATKILTDPNAHFQTNGVGFGDLIYIFTVAPQGTTVASVTSETTLVTTAAPMADESDIAYKVGVGAAHTMRTLIDIVGQRGVVPYTVHHHKLWSEAVLADFNDDETGEVYVM